MHIRSSVREHFTPTNQFNSFCFSNQSDMTFTHNGCLPSPHLLILKTYGSCQHAEHENLGPTHLVVNRSLPAPRVFLTSVVLPALVVEITVKTTPAKQYPEFHVFSCRVSINDKREALYHSTEGFTTKITRSVFVYFVKQYQQLSNL